MISDDNINRAFKFHVNDEFQYCCHM